MLHYVFSVLTFIGLRYITHTALDRRLICLINHYEWGSGLFQSILQQVVANGSCEYMKSYYNGAARRIYASEI